MIKEVKLVNATVAELISVLSAYPPDTKIAVEGCGYTEVYITHDNEDYIVFS